MELLSGLEGPVVTGGAWGTELQARGLPLDGSPDSWNITRPNVIEEIAAEYAAAGSCIVLTNTFQANRIALDRHGLASQVGRINRLGVIHARRGVDHAALVFGSIGPTGEATPTEQSAAFHEQAEALAEANAQGLVIETMTLLAECRLALDAALLTGLPTVVTLAPGYGRSTDALTSGEPVVDVLQELLDRGAAHVGLNCIDPKSTVGLCKKIARKLNAPLWMKPNAGRPLIVDGIPRYGVGPREFAEHGVELVKAGAAFVGGCCGVGPAHIVELSEALVLGEAA